MLPATDILKLSCELNLTKKFIFEIIIHIMIKTMPENISKK
jgi:hypothetical protein